MSIILQFYLLDREATEEDVLAWPPVCLGGRNRTWLGSKDWPAVPRLNDLVEFHNWKNLPPALQCPSYVGVVVDVVHVENDGIHTVNVTMSPI